MENEVFWGLTYRSVSATAYLDHSLKARVGHFTKAPKLFRLPLELIACGAMFAALAGLARVW
jgi:hypothetical protein